MSDLSRDTKDLLSRGRTGPGMPPRRRSAVKGAVLAKVAAGTVVTTSATAAAWTTTTKVIGAAIVAVAVSGGTVGVVKYQNARYENAKSQTAAKAAAVPIATRATTIAPVEAPTETTPAPMPVAPMTDVLPAATTAIAPTPIAVVPPASTSTSTSTHSSLAAETSLLRDAHDALASGNPTRALALLDEHARRYPSSALEPERSAERVFAYCAENSIDAAHGAAASFLAAHPTGPLADRVRSSCGGKSSQN